MAEPSLESWNLGRTTQNKSLSFSRRYEITKTCILQGKGRVLPNREKAKVTFARSLARSSSHAQGPALLHLGNNRDFWKNGFFALESE